MIVYFKDIFSDVNFSPFRSSSSIIWQSDNGRKPLQPMELMLFYKDSANLLKFPLQKKKKKIQICEKIQRNSFGYKRLLIWNICFFTSKKLSGFSSCFKFRCSFLICCCLVIYYYCFFFTLQNIPFYLNINVS